ncbi:hypothetical protein AB3S75_037047 [Citrus x aurantiifolia]
MALHYYHKRILCMLGQIIGNVFRIDYNTESASRGKFARIAVEVPLNTPLVSQFFLDAKIQKVEYESLPNICFHCGKYGHTSALCPDHPRANDNSGVLASDAAENISGNNPIHSTMGPSGGNPKFGPWMVVTKKGRFRVDKKRAIERDSDRSNWNNFGNGSHFEALANVNEERLPSETNKESSTAFSES